MAEEIEVAGLVTKISMDDTDVVKSMAALDRQMKLVQSEFNKAASGLTNFGKSEESLAVKSDSLTKQLDIQGQRIAHLNKQYQQSVKEKGQDAVATQNLEVKLNKAVATYNKLDAELNQTNKELAEQTDEWNKLSKSLDAAGKKMQGIGNRMSDVGKTMTTSLSLPLAALGGLSSKAAIDFESAFAGVRKTVNATESEFDDLEKGIRDMAKEIPAAATEIAGVAEAAGQLGIQKDAILDFSRTMIDLGETTNLSSDQAATALARLANITQMPQSQFDRLGSTIAELGNNLATTESEIVEMGLRIAGAGEQIGLTEAQILSFAGALSSVGIEAEAGGSAISRVFVDMAQAASTGSEDLQKFAQVAGMTAAEFKQSFEEDAAGAVISFIEGLGRMSKEGENTFGVLEDLGLSEIRVRDALLRASNAGDLFRESIELGSKAWEENTALTNEAAQRYDTTAAKLEVLRNRLVDVGINIGNALIPALMDVIDAMEPLFRMVENLATSFAELDKASQTTIIVMGALAAAIGPVVLVVGKLVSAVGVISTEFGKLSKAIAKAGGIMAVITGPIGVITAAVAGLVAIGVALYKNWDRIMSLSGPLRGAILGLLGPISAVIGVIKGLQNLFSRSIPEVETYGEEAQKAAQKASGSFADYRRETKQNLEETSKVAKTEGEKTGKNLAEGIAKGTGEAKRQAVDDMRDMVDEMKATVDRSADSLNRLGDAITESLKRQYDEAEQLQTEALEKQVEAEKRASDERLKVYDQEYTEKLKLIDEEAYNQIKALQEEIDAIDNLTEAEEKAKREQEYLDRVAEYQRQLAAAETAEEREKIQRDLNKTISDYERQQLLEQRRLQKDALKDQIDAVKDAADERKKELQQELEDKKQSEKDKLEVTLETLDDEKAALKEHYEQLKQSESLQAEARKLIIEQNNDEIVQLLETYNPKWQDAGQSFADAFAEGLNSEKQTIEEAVSGITSIAPNIDSQIAELDRLQSKLKELEQVANASSGGGGSLGIDLDPAIEQSDALAESLTDTVVPAIEDVGSAAEGMQEEALKAFLGLNNDVTTELYRMKFSGEEITEETAASIADKFFAMGNTILENLDVSHTERLNSLRDFFADSETLTEEEESKALQKLEESKEEEAKAVRNGQNRIAEILSTALDENRGIKKEEYDEILRIQGEMMEDAERTLGAHELEQKKILERMKADAESITAEQVAEVVKQSVNQKDQAIKAAEEQYDKVIGEIIRQRDEAKSISSEQAEALIKDAKRQRDESISAAEQMHKDVVREAKDMASEFKDEIDWATGEILSGWEIFTNKMGDVIGGLWGRIKEDFKQIGTDIITSLVQGMSGKLPVIAEKVKGIADNIPDWMKDALGIQSPSRVMMKIGEDTGAGLEIGLQKSLRGIRQQTALMASATLPSMNSLQSQPVMARTRETNTTNMNFERMFEGSTFIVRSDNDAKLIAREMFNLSLGRAQSEGV